MPYTLFNLQLFGEEGDVSTDTGVVAGDSAENVSTDGVATGSATEQIATAAGDETWDSLIKGKYKDDYSKSVQDAVNKRFKNQRDLQSQIDMIDPIIRELANKYGVKPDVNGRIDINSLNEAYMNDNSRYEEEAFKRGMSVDDYKQMKQLEAENARLKAANQRTEQDQEWEKIVQEGEALREMYPSFDLEAEMQNPEFGRTFASLQRNGFPNALKRTYEIVHMDEIMGGAMKYSVEKTQEKISNSIQANLSRPTENGVASSAAAQVGAVDPSKLTKSQIEDIKARAARGERITFA